MDQHGLSAGNPLVRECLFCGSSVVCLAATGLGVRICSGGAAKQNRLAPWAYDRAMYKRRNEIERLFRRLKGFRRISSLFDKRDVRFVAFITFAVIVDGLR